MPNDKPVTTKTETIANGLKDHEIAQLVNDVRDGLKHIIPHECLRELVNKNIVSSLERMHRRIDAKPVTTKYQRRQKLWDQAFETVKRIRGSSDVPAFDLCVEAEYKELLEKKDDN